jgi:hypothetical protein
MNNLKQTTLTDDNFDTNDKPHAVDSQVGGNNAAVRPDLLREIELEARLLSYAEDLMKGFLDEEVSDPDEIRSQKRAYILYNIWWTSFFAIVNLHTEHLCNNRTLHANLRRSCGHFWRANLLPSFDAIKLKAILPKLFVAADRTTLLVLNELWREHQESMYVSAISRIRMPDGHFIFDKRDQSRQYNADGLHSRVQQVLRSPVSFGKYTVQFARDYDVARRRGELYWPIEPANWRTNANISSIENKAIMFTGVVAGSFDSVKTISSDERRFDNGT